MATTTRSASKKANGGAKTGTPVGVSDAQLKRFMALFPGYSKYHGRFDLKAGVKDESGKVKGQAKTVKGPATPQVFREHLDGTGSGAGIIMLDEHDETAFGAIDYDNKKVNHAKLEAQVKALGLPLVICRSKSGGAHLYCFVSVPVPASLMRTRLAEWVSLLGWAQNTEQFPKQEARFNENDIGSWINLPYYAAKETDRWAMVDGKVVDLKTFLDIAEASRVEPHVLEKSATDEAAEDEANLFYEGPPCLHVIHSQGGFAEGARNNGMTNVIVYLRKRYGDNWKQHLDAYNQVMAGLPSEEIVQIAKSYGKKDYTYACKQEPLKGFCQRKACLGRLYGIGKGDQGARSYDINNITRYDSPHGDDPIWMMEVNGKRIQVTNSQFYSRDEFNRACMAQANVVPVHVPPAQWLKKLCDLIANCDAVELPDDAGPTGQLWMWIRYFTTEQAPAQDKDGVLLGQVWREGGMVYFRSSDLFKFLESRKIKFQSQQAVFLLIKKHGGARKFHKLSGAGENGESKGVNLWTLPFKESDVSLELPPSNFEQDEDF